MSEKWTAEQIPSQAGRVVVVTGANSGLGLITARELARAGASVVMACRNAEKAASAADTVRAAAPDADIEVEALDLASLQSVNEFAQRFRSSHDSLDLLIDNAGVMAVSPRGETADGFERQFGTNHLGHFALAAQLIDMLEGRDDARVVTLSSNAHKLGKIRLDDLQGESGRYRRWRAYCQSKLANLMFALELDRRLRAAGSNVKSIGAHPGYSHTNLQFAQPPLVDRAIMRVTNALGAQDAEMGTLPQLYAATNPDVEGGQYVGPDGFNEQRGYPRIATPTKAARDEETARRLWEVSEELTGVRWELAVAAA
jgi:NAD(P)-dependent dehydrogenase (short-subunit alcohol dehydrogenase family)